MMQSLATQITLVLVLVFRRLAGSRVLTQTKRPQLLPCSLSPARTCTLTQPLDCPLQKSGVVSSAEELQRPVPGSRGDAGVLMLDGSNPGDAPVLFNLASADASGEFDLPASSGGSPRSAVCVITVARGAVAASWQGVRVRLHGQLQ